MTYAIAAIGILAAACIYLGVRLDRATKDRNRAQQRVMRLEMRHGWHHPDEPDYVKGSASFTPDPDKPEYDWVRAPYLHTTMVVPKGYGREVAAACNLAERYGRNHMAVYVPMKKP